MKRCYVVITCLCALLLCGCGQRYDAVLTDIDSLIDVNADSALVQLSGIDTLELSTANRMYYLLLEAKVCDQLDSLEMSDSQAERLVTYFEDDGDERLQPLAYYYGGRICAEADNVPQALDYFHKAEILLIAKDDNPALLSKVYSQMGYLFVYRKMYDEARNNFKESYKLDKVINDTLGMIFNLRDIGTSLAWADQEKEALPYYIKARALAISCHDEVMRHDLEMSLTHAYHKTGQIDSAKYYAKRIMNEVTSIDSSAVFSIVSAVYYDTGQKDSAELLLNKLLICGTKSAKCYAHEKLTEMSIQKGSVDEAILHHKQYRTYRDTLNKEFSTSAIAQANSAYNYQSKEKENYLLKLANAQVKLILLCIIGCVVIITLTSIFFFNRYRHRQAEKLKELERIKNEQRLQSEKFIAENQQRIAELEKLLQQSSTLSADQRKEMESEKAKLTSSNEIARLKNIESKRALDNIRSSSVFLRMMDLVEHDMPQKITDDDWDELKNVINREYENFNQKIDSLCHPNSTDLKVCLLLKAQVEPLKIAMMVMRAKNSVSSIRSRLYQKAFGCKGSAKDWDEVINSL